MVSRLWPRYVCAWYAKKRNDTEWQCCAIHVFTSNVLSACCAQMQSKSVNHRVECKYTFQTEPNMQKYVFWHLSTCPGILDIKLYLQGKKYHDTYIVHWLWWISLNIAKYQTSFIVMFFFLSDLMKSRVGQKCVQIPSAVLGMCFLGIPYL